jgi:hypothetical protein
MTCLSFNGDPGAKRHYLDRLRNHIAAGNFQFSPVWADGKGSALGCTIEADDIDRYADTLGVPAALAMVLDDLVNAQPSEPSFRHATDFALRWLAAIPVGADLSPIPGTIICALLGHVMLCDTTSRHPAMDEVRRAVSDLHFRVLDGQEVNPTSWREVRRRAVRITDAVDGEIESGAARVIEAAAWPHLTRTALRDTLDALSRLANDKAMQAIGWTMAEETATFAMFDAIFTEKAATGETMVGDDLLAELTRRDPLLGARFEERNGAADISRNIRVLAGEAIMEQFATVGGIQDGPVRLPRRQTRSS